MTPTAADVRDAQAVLGSRAQFLASGATCTVFTDGQRVLRLSDPNPGRAARFRVDAQIRAALRAAGVCTAQVHELGELPGGRPYSLEELARGDDSHPNAQGWEDVGRALQVLHALPHSRYGLLQDTLEGLRGQAFTPAEGMLTRLQQVWPLHHQPLRAHPLIWAAPDLIPILKNLEDDLWEVLQGPSAVCHTDLHPNQFMWRLGRLAYLLDFGDASSGPPAWDVASLAYFHGWEVAARVAQAAGLPCGRSAALLGLMIAFHRASRAVTLNRPAMTGQAVEFARACLARA